MTSPIDKLEQKRLELQQALDGQKSAAERNRLGQFATPTALACEILRYGVSLLPLGREIRFLDPAIGTGAFYSALQGRKPPPLPPEQILFVARERDQLMKLLAGE